MADTVAELAERGLKLSPEDRARLVDLLLAAPDESMQTQIDDAWRSELRRRVTAYDRGETVLHNVDDVLAEAKLIAP